MELVPLSRGKYEDDGVDDAPGDGTETEHAVDESTPSPDESVESNVESVFMDVKMVWDDRDEKRVEAAFHSSRYLCRLARQCSRKTSDQRVSVVLQEQAYR